MVSWTVCAITGTLIGMTIPIAVILCGALFGIVGNQIRYENVNGWSGMY